VKRAGTFLPIWALQFVIGMFAVLLAVGLFAALIGSVVKGPQNFFDEVGRTVARVAPQPQADVRSDADLKAVIKALPDGRLRVASVVADQDRVVFTVTADRAAVKAAVQSGDELRVSRTTGEVEIAPTGIPGLVDRLQQAIEDLRRSWFGK
jgi:anti-sigma factor RsiW